MANAKPQLDSQKLMAVRRKAGLTQKELADFLYASATVVSCWETGARNPTPSSIFGIAYILRVDFFDLIKH